MGAPPTAPEGASIALEAVVSPRVGADPPCLPVVWGKGFVVRADTGVCPYGWMSTTLARTPPPGGGWGEVLNSSQQRVAHLNSSPLGFAAFVALAEKEPLNQPPMGAEVKAPARPC